MDRVSLYTAAQMRRMDQALAARREVESYRLMQDAAAAALQVLLSNWPRPGKVVVLAGSGNNAGDGWLLAVLLKQQGHAVQVLSLSDPEALGGDAGQAFAEAKSCGLDWRQWNGGESSDAAFGEAGLLVDAMLGTGLRGALRAPYDAAVRAVNASPAPCLAIDIPTGLQADTGAVDGVAVQADITVTFVGCKRGLLTAHGPDCCGALVLDDLGWSEHCAGLQLDADSEDGAATVMLAGREVLQRLPPRPACCHKSHYGRVLIVAGQPGMAGAGLLASAAALRSGAGLVILATHAAHAAALHTARPEMMLCAVSGDAEQDGSGFDEQLAAADAVVIGPGLGRGDWGRYCWSRLRRAIQKRDRPPELIIDADGLYWLLREPLAAEHPRPVITPHPGEAALLLETTPATVQRDRFDAAARLAERLRAHVVLKGNGSLIASPDGELALCRHGNPGMATAGAGDVLSGVCGAMLGRRQGDDSRHERAVAAVVAHALAADLALAGPGRHGPGHSGSGHRGSRLSGFGHSGFGHSGLIAGDIVRCLPRILP